MKKLQEIQAELKAPKNQRNNFGKYNYRSCEDILEAVKPLLKGATLVISDEIKELAGLVFVEATATITDGKEVIQAKAQAGIDPNRKGMDIAQSFGSSSSYARKYALNGLFLIDDTKDADATNTHGNTPKKVTKLPELKPNTDNWEKVVKAIENGFTIEQIKKKYTITKENEQLLTK